MPWRLPDWAYRTLPEPVILNRFLATYLVFCLGIWLSSMALATGLAAALRQAGSNSSMLIEHLSPSRQPFSRTARGRVMAEDAGKDNSVPAFGELFRPPPLSRRI